jgi:hypothetical protein
MSKNPNAMDIMIEEGKSVLRSWGADEADFLLTNSKLTFQMTMIPEKTQFLSQGVEGQKRLKAGPDINSYRGLNIINSRSFSLEDGAPPRDVLRRRTRVAEYYRIPWEQGIENKSFSFYDEAKDAWQKFTWRELFELSTAPSRSEMGEDDDDRVDKIDYITTKLPFIFDQLAGLDKMISRGVWDDMIPEYGQDDPWTAIAAVGALDFGPGIPLPAATVLNARPFAPAPRLIPAEAARLWDCVNIVGVPAVGGAAAIAAKPITVDNYKLEHAIFVSDLKQFLIGQTMYMDKGKIDYFNSIDWYSNPRNMARAVAAVFDVARFPSYMALGALPGALDYLTDNIKEMTVSKYELVIVRPNIEHNMLGIIMGKGGIEPLGATLWGQTELSVYDDSMHGIWGMSYKYNERAIVFNHKNLIRLWDVGYDGYNGGKDCKCVDWHSQDSLDGFKDSTYELNRAYEGASMMVMAFKDVNTSDPWPSPIVFHDAAAAEGSGGGGSHYLDGEHQHQIKKDAFRVFNRSDYTKEYRKYFEAMPNFTRIHNPKKAGTSSEENESSCNSLAFQGSMRVHTNAAGMMGYEEITGNGHHGLDYVGVASVRAGKGIMMGSLAQGSNMRLL